jgi:hypothetical protein
LLLYLVSTLPFLSYLLEFLVCDACELAKHTRGSYPSACLRNSKAFEIIHYDVWRPREVHSIYGHR